MAIQRITTENPTTMGNSNSDHQHYHPNRRADDDCSCSSFDGSQNVAFSIERKDELLLPLPQHQTKQQQLPSCCFPCSACQRCLDNEDDEENNDENRIGTTTTSTRSSNRKSHYTMCEIRRHNTTESAWIVAGTDIYDVTEYMNIHPGGSTSLLKKSGGIVDCTRDLKFHSKRGQKLWQQYHVGKVIPCPSSSSSSSSSQRLSSSFDKKDWWKFWE